MNLGEWATRLLSFGDWPFNADKQLGVVAWAVAEGSPCNCNPLDTTEPATGATNCNSVGVKSYPTVDIGIEATFTTLHNGYYPGVLAVLADPGAGAYALAHAVGNSPWGTGNFSRVVDTVRADPGPYFSRPVVGSGPDPLPPEPPTEGDNVTSYIDSDGVQHVYAYEGGSCIHWRYDPKIGHWVAERLPNP